MATIIYDGSFFGLVSSLYSYLQQRRLPDAIDCENAAQPSLLFAEPETGKNLTNAPGRNAYDPEVFRIPGVSRETWQNAWHAFLSQAPHIELSIARYLLFAIDKGGSVDSHLTDNRVIKVHRLAQKVLKERHRFMGLLRFRNIGNNLYYASLRSDNFLLPILAPFFVRRLGDQQWIIHDRRREMAAVYNLKSWTMVERNESDMPADSGAESDAQYLWQSFFDSIAVRERLNLSLQQKFIPKKYWQDLIEKPGR